MTRIFDFILSLFGIFFLLPIFLIIYVLIFILHGKPIFSQIRVGKNLKEFKILKFRTMKLNTESVGTHLVDRKSITSIGLFLRKYKLDELPQLINVIRGEMSLVGPRPCLYNQYELIKFRKELGVFNVRPGITGLAQIKNIDMSNPKILANIDLKMIKEYNLLNYFKYIFLTFFSKKKLLN